METNFIDDEIEILKDKDDSSIKYTSEGEFPIEEEKEAPQKFAFSFNRLVKEEKKHDIDWLPPVNHYND